MDFPKLLNITELARLAKVSYNKMYFRKNGHIKGQMKQTDRTKIVNAIRDEIKPFLKELGYDISISQRAT